MLHAHIVDFKGVSVLLLGEMYVELAKYCSFNIAEYMFGEQRLHVQDVCNF